MVMHVTFDSLKTFYNILVQKLKNHRGNWNQNDPAADDYIKNRTHWEEKKNIQILKHTEVAVLSQPFMMIEPVSSLAVGEEYVVTYDGIKYNCVAYLVGDGAVAIGNEDLFIFETIDNGKGEGEPFFFANYVSEFSVIFPADSNTIHTISIDGPVIIVHKLDSKYLDIPTNLATTDEVYTKDEVYSKDEVYTKDEVFSKDIIFQNRPDYNNDDPTSLGYIKNRPMHILTTEAENVIFEGWIDGRKSITTYTPPLNQIPITGETYHIYVDGESKGSNIYTGANIIAAGVQLDFNPYLYFTQVSNSWSSRRHIKVVGKGIQKVYGIPPYYLDSGFFVGNPDRTTSNYLKLISDFTLGLSKNKGGQTYVVPSIKSASVDQTIAVSAIDDEGRPIEWKAVDINSVLYTEQTLTEEQKEQARKNINAATIDEIGSYELITPEDIDAICGVTT